MKIIEMKFKKYLKNIFNNNHIYFVFMFINIFDH